MALEGAHGVLKIVECIPDRKRPVCAEIGIKLPHLVGRRTRGKLWLVTEGGNRLRRLDAFHHVVNASPSSTRRPALAARRVDHPVQGHARAHAASPRGRSPASAAPRYSRNQQAPMGDAMLNLLEPVGVKAYRDRAQAGDRKIDVDPRFERVPASFVAELRTCSRRSMCPR